MKQKSTSFVYTCDGSGKAFVRQSKRGLIVTMKFWGSFVLGSKLKWLS